MNHNIEDFLALIIVLASVIIIYSTKWIDNIYADLLPVAGILGVILYYIGYGSSISLDQISRNEKIVKILSLALCIQYIIIFSTYIMNGYNRGVVIHFLTGICYVISVFIFTSSYKKLGLFQFIITAIIHRGTIYFSSPLYMGHDVFFHNWVSRQIASKGSLNPLLDDRYFYSPLYHIFDSQLINILSLSHHEATFGVSIGVTLGIILSIYITVREITDSYHAILGTFLYSTSDFVVNWTIQPQATTMALAFSPLLIYAIIRLSITKNITKIKLLYILLFATITMSNHASALIMAIFIFAYISIRQLYIGELENLNIQILTILYIMISFMYSRYYGPLGERSFLDIAVSIITISIQSIGSESSAYSLPEGVYAIGSDGLAHIHIVGFIILMTLSISGGLIWLSQDIRKDICYGLGVSVTGMLTISFLGPLFGVNSLMPWRWFAFIYIALSIFASIGAGALAFKGPHNRKMTLMVVLLILLPYVILMGGNFRGAYDNPLFDQSPGAERYSVNQDELHALKFSNEYNAEPISSDTRFSVILERYYRIDSTTIEREYHNPNSIINYSNDYLLLREYSGSKHSRSVIYFDNTSQEVYGDIEYGRISEKEYLKVYSGGRTELWKQTN